MSLSSIRDVYYVGGMAEIAATSWATLIEQSVSHRAQAQEHYLATLRAAIAAGLTYREVGDAAGLSAQAVHKAVGPRDRATLDSPASVNGAAR